MARIMVSLALILMGFVGQALAREPVLIGRLMYLEGDVLRYITAEDDWVATVEDTPVAAEDMFYSEPRARGEFMFPNNTWVRIGGNTGVNIVTVQNDLTGLYIDSGVLRVYNKSDRALVRVETRLGYLVAEPGDVVDLYVGDRDIEVIALEGSPNFFYTAQGDRVRYEILADGPSLLVDSTSVESAEPYADREWEAWNYQRDQFWAQRTRVRSAHLPDYFQTDAEVFEREGRWERVQYRGNYVWCWTPIHVDVHWRPFTVGRWTTYYEENVWIPYEPWGWVTHHYGHWIHVENRWWWTPYISVDVVTPGVDVRVNVGVPPPPNYYYYWHPGRVAWIHTEVHVGWFPLAPWEPYYGWRPWYGNTVIVNTTNITNININIANYTYVESAIVVGYDRFYNVPYRNNYLNHTVVNVTNINRTTIINNYYAAPIIHKTVIKNQNIFHNHYHFTDRTVMYKPHHSVVERAVLAKTEFYRRGPKNAADFRVEVEKVRKIDPVRSAHPQKRLEGLVASNKLVRHEDVRKPADKLQFEKRALKLEAQKPRLHEEERQKARLLKEASASGRPSHRDQVERPGEITRGGTLDRGRRKGPVGGEEGTRELSIKERRKRDEGGPGLRDRDRIGAQEGPKRTEEGPGRRREALEEREKRRAERGFTEERRERKRAEGTELERERARGRTSEFEQSQRPRREERRVEGPQRGAQVEEKGLQQKGSRERRLEETSREPGIGRGTGLPGQERGVKSGGGQEVTPQGQFIDKQRKRRPSEGLKGDEGPGQTRSQGLEGQQRRQTERPLQKSPPDEGQQRRLREERKQAPREQSMTHPGQGPQGQGIRGAEMDQGTRQRQKRPSELQPNLPSEQTQQRGLKHEGQQRPRQEQGMRPAEPQQGRKGKGSEVHGDIQPQGQGVKRQLQQPGAGPAVGSPHAIGGQGASGQKPSEEGKKKKKGDRGEEPK